jgi:hypothetical protein
MTGGWMSNESARERKAGTKGSFARKAARRGMSTSELATKEEHASGKIGQQARMAKMYAKGRAAKRHKKQHRKSSHK